MSFPQDFRRKTDGGVGECGNCGKVEKLWKSGNGQKRLLVSAKVDGMRKSFAVEKVAGNPVAASKTKEAETCGKVAETCGSSRRFGEGGIPVEAFQELERVFPAFWGRFRLFVSGGNWSGKGKAESFKKKVLKKFLKNAERVAEAERSGRKPKTKEAETCGKVAETCGRACVVGVFGPEKLKTFPGVSLFIFHFSFFSFFVFLKSLEKRRNVSRRGSRSKNPQSIPKAKSMLFSSVFFMFFSPLKVSRKSF